MSDSEVGGRASDSVSTFRLEWGACHADETNGTNHRGLGQLKVEEHEQPSRHDALRVTSEFPTDSPMARRGLRRRRSDGGPVGGDPASSTNRRRSRAHRGVRCVGRRDDDDRRSRRQLASVVVPSRHRRRPTRDHRRLPRHPRSGQRRTAVLHLGHPDRSVLLPPARGRTPYRARRARAGPRTVGAQHNLFRRSANLADDHWGTRHRHLTRRLGRCRRAPPRRGDELRRDARPAHRSAQPVATRGPAARGPGAAAPERRAGVRDTRRSGPLQAAQRHLRAPRRR